MEVIVNLTRKDYSNFNKYYYFKKGLKKRFLIVLIISIALTISMCIGKGYSIVGYANSFIISLAIFSIFYLGGGYLMINRTGSLPSENGSMLGEKKFIIADEGFIEESENNRNITKWAGIQSVEQNKDLIFIFVDRIAAYIIPKRYFQNKEEIKMFIKKLNDKINVA